MRNEFTTSRRCSGKRLYKQSWSHTNKQAIWKSRFGAETMDAMKNSPEPLRLRFASRCASCGMSPVCIVQNKRGGFHSKGLLVSPIISLIASVVSPTVVIAPTVSLAFTKHPAHQSTALMPQNGRSCYTNECADPSRNHGIS
jgi:hypothetical protein